MSQTAALSALSTMHIEPLIKHQNTVYLLFSPKSLPYAELAAYKLACNHLLADTTAHPPAIRVGLDRNLLAQQTTLTIPKGPLASAKTTISGKCSIVRYFARALRPLSSVSLYPENSPVAKHQIDSWVDDIRAASASPDALVKVLEAAAPSTALVGETTTIADLLAWDALISNGSSSPKLAGWLKSIHASQELSEAVSTIDKIVETAPILDVFRYSIIEQMQPLTGASIDLLYSLLEEPRDRANGDISLPLPRARLPGNPSELAASLAQKFKPNNLILSASATGPFLNFTYNKEVLREKIITNVISLDTEFGSNSDGFGNCGVVEYSSPNIAKPFHAGHLRSTIIGSFVKTVLDLSGWSTVSINYLGDWGKQFGILAVGFDRYGSEEELQKDPIRHLYDVYVKINTDASEDASIHEEARAYFRKMEDGDEHAYALWKKFRDLSIVKYKEVYSRLNVYFDIYSGESQYSLTQMRSVMDGLKDAGLLVPDQGALVVNLKEYKLGVAVIGKTDGTLLYLSRDIAAACDRRATFDFDHMFYIVGTQQDHHFKQLFKILELQDKTWVGKCTLIGFGMIKSKDGNMSSRKGTVVFLEDILDAVKDEMHTHMKKNERKYAQIVDPEHVADIVGQSATKIQDMAARRSRDYTFDWARIFSFEGDTGPYLQYAHSRLCSIERQSSHLKVTPETILEIDLTLLVEPQAFALMEAIAAYPDVIRDLGKNYEPCNLVSYALKLSHAVSSAIDVLWVSGQEEPLAHARLALYVTARFTLGSALKTLGLIPLSRM
ncbi:hypothetical protein BASA50_004175 [Batrachochytrium salamandrivorans]|uniref:arginine--tRNA ligase n=1 Tax=Batrachochytrium salamandrivorans TaxID=1357716 RepID=A0ABQ8FGB8_9FUNG|nr:hypothetical protein BASA50_004175 [Batrachochytrium salamandrivorans]